MIQCDLDEDGLSWSSMGTVDHPSFTRLRNHLAHMGYIKIPDYPCVNGDIVTKEFYVNNIPFKRGDRFYSACAIWWKLQVK